MGFAWHIEVDSNLGTAYITVDTKKANLSVVSISHSVCVYICMCDTLGIQGFLRFSGELVSFEELGQLDLIKVL